MRHDDDDGWRALDILIWSLFFVVNVAQCYHLAKLEVRVDKLGPPATEDHSEVKVRP